MNILIFGPNGSGKGTQGAIVKEKFHIAHVESGAIFRQNIKGGTELGKKAKEFIDRGDLVPDEITIPMILDRLQEDDCKSGWLLDGFPRNVEQAKALHQALKDANIDLNFIIEIQLERSVAKNRIMGRRLCKTDPNHPNNIFIDAIKPAEKDGSTVCQKCGAELTERADDQDESAIDKRHDIYYSETDGTMAAVNYFKNVAEQSKQTNLIELDGAADIKSISENLASQLG